MDGIIECPQCGARNRVPRAHPGSPECGRCHSPLPWLISAGDTDFDEVTAAASLPVLVDLWAPWCGPCLMLAPVVEGITRTQAGRIKVVKVNVDESPAIARRFGVQGIPTLLILRSGRVVARQVGALSARALESWLQDATDRAA